LQSKIIRGTEMNSLQKHPFPFMFYQPDPPEEPPSGQCDCDGGDCACSLPSVSIGSVLQVFKTSEDIRLKRSPGSSTMWLKDEYFLCYGPFHKPVLINSLTKDILNQFGDPINTNHFLSSKQNSLDQDVLDSLIANLKEASLIVEESFLPELISSPQTLSSWFHITDRCNLRCEYCYLPHLKKDMTTEVGEGSLDAVFRSAHINGYKQVKVKYAGGEALLRFSFVEKMHGYAQQLSNEYGIKLNEVILSNGTLLTHNIAKSIKSMGMRLMISVDGIGIYHDAQRPYANGKGSFADTQRGVSIAIEEEVPIDISITISAKNIDGLPEILEWILQKNLPFSLNFYRENDLVIDMNKLKFEEDKIIEGVLAAYKVIENNLPERSLLSSLVDRANLSSPHLRTCGVGESYLVFGHDGQVSKCQMQMGKPITSFKSNDPLLEVRSDNDGIQNLVVHDKEGCRDCSWKHWCAGGCSLSTFRATGRYDIKSPNCNIYKALYPEAMKLEGLRLLKLANKTKLMQ